MPRATLTLLVGAVVLLSPSAALGVDPHVDPSLLPDGCVACHKGHGEPGSPMLPNSQKGVCLSCHDSQAGADEQVRGGRLSSGAEPRLLSRSLSQPFVHPMSDTAFSRHEPGAVTCTSCHSPHRSGRPGGGGALDAAPRKRMSPRNPTRFEYELCESCHGQEGVMTQSPRDISRLFNPNSRSYHPVEAPAAESSVSVLPTLVGREISCTDCHGNDDAGGARGLHGSGVRFLLNAPYTILDGSEEGTASYGLCYRCHERERVLDSAAFPEHRSHIVDERASCATCHNPHGSVDNRALIRFGEETIVGGVSPSGVANRLEFVSDGPGSGACYLTCHGFDHAPGVYGGLPPATEPLALPKPETRGLEGSPSQEPLRPRPRKPVPRR